MPKIVWSVSQLARAPRHGPDLPWRTWIAAAAVIVFLGGFLQVMAPENLLAAIIVGLGAVTAFLLPLYFGRGTGGGRSRSGDRRSRSARPRLGSAGGGRQAHYAPPRQNAGASPATVRVSTIAPSSPTIEVAENSPQGVQYVDRAGARRTRSIVALAILLAVGISVGIFWTTKRGLSAPDSPNSWAVAVSKDGRLAATSDNGDGKIRLWEISSLKQLGAFSVGTPGLVVEDLSFSPDGRTLAIPVNLGIELWDVKTLRRIGDIKTPKYARRAAFSPDGRTLVSVGIAIDFWDVATRRPLGRRITSLGDNFWSAAFSPDGKSLATCGFDLRIWNVHTRTQIGETFPDTPTSTSCDVEFSPDGKALAFANGQADTKVFSTKTHRQLAVLHDGRAGAAAVSFSSDGRWIAATGSSHTMTWRVSDGKPSGYGAIASEGSFQTTGIDFVPNSMKAVVAGTSVELLDLASGKTIDRFKAD